MNGQTDAAKERAATCGALLTFRPKRAAPRPRLAQQNAQRFAALPVRFACGAAGRLIRKSGKRQQVSALAAANCQPACARPSAAAGTLFPPLRIFCGDKPGVVVYIVSPFTRQSHAGHLFKPTGDARIASMTLADRSLHGARVRRPCRVAAVLCGANKQCG